MGERGIVYRNALGGIEGVGGACVHWRLIPHTDGGTGRALCAWGSHTHAHTQVQLRFEPREKISASEAYRIAAKENRCVACGATSNYVRYQQRWHVYTHVNTHIYIQVQHYTGMLPCSPYEALHAQARALAARKRVHTAIVRELHDTVDMNVHTHARMHAQTHACMHACVHAYMSGQ